MYDEKTEHTYDRAGFGAPVRRGQRPAILVVDLSRGFTEPQWPTGADLTDVVAATARLVEAARRIAAPVIYTTIAYDPAEADGHAYAWLDKAPGLRVLRSGSELVDLDPRLPREDRDPVIVKKGASAFFGTHLAATLTSLGADTVVVCGATTSGCVRASVVDAVQSGFPVLVPRECVGDRAQGPHDANLFDIDAKYGDVIDLDDAVQYLGGLAPAEVAS
ncbi:MAG TPA: isochorismatase family protein [Baekduia sp.]|uniref:isochorismatase family protein n=1 Tax=Baekduia sp. TaxID=2600305 RepID=UPI002CD6EA8D|nr:isochorismatase family protein [Baekduia sp.]HMJ33516.1 isochorismatase family protein [Baekduia sp.]